MSERPFQNMIGLRAQSGLRKPQGGSSIASPSPSQSPTPSSFSSSSSANAAEPPHSQNAGSQRGGDLSPGRSPMQPKHKRTNSDEDSDSGQSDAAVYKDQPELVEGRARLGTLALEGARGSNGRPTQSVSMAASSSGSPQPPPKKAPRDFRIERVLGEGAYGCVKLATEIATGQKVAIKVLEKNHIVREKKVEWVEREKKLLDKLRHPNIITLYSTFQDHCFLYFVLELCPNGEFLNVLQKYGGLAVKCARHYASEIVCAVEYMHSMGVVHRDLKPENMLLTADNHIKIIDFGTAKEIGSSKAARTFSFCGTAEYLSPEMLKTSDNQGYGFASDLWALGCVLYQILSGRPPFRAKAPLLIFQKIQARELFFPENFPPLGRGLVEGLLVLDPAQRCGVRAGFQEIRSNPFFAGVDFAAVAVQRVPLPPFEPPLPSIVWPPPPPEERQETHEERQEREAAEARQAKLDEQRKSPWAPFLQQDELIVETGLVNKKKGLFSRRRQLFITDTPRIFYIDPERSVLRGEVPWTRDISCEIRDNRHFNIHTPNRIYLLDDLSASSHRWHDAINRLKQVQLEREKEKKEKELLAAAQKRILEERGDL